MIADMLLGDSPVGVARVCMLMRVDDDMRLIAQTVIKNATADLVALYQAFPAERRTSLIARCMHEMNKHQELEYIKTLIRNGESKYVGVFKNLYEIDLYPVNVTAVGAGCKN
jgi:hypothetical protein